MVLKQQKIDITDRVIGKIKNNEIELYLENQAIGKVKLPPEAQFELTQHYEENDQKIFQHITATEQPNARYTDCDEGGWC